MLVVQAVNVLWLGIPLRVWLENRLVLAYFDASDRPLPDLVQMRCLNMSSMLLRSQIPQATANPIYFFKTAPLWTSLLP